MSTHNGDHGPPGGADNIAIVPPPTIKSYILLGILSSIHLFAELGHYLIGVVSRDVARDLHYGTQDCFPNLNVSITDKRFTSFCKNFTTQEACMNAKVASESTTPLQCTWDYTGLGLEYQFLAGPAYMAVFTLCSIGWGLAADKYQYSRVKLITLSTTSFSLALGITALATSYSQLLVLRMLLAAGVAGVAPLAPGMLFSAFPETNRGLAMGIFHWGVYIGYGLTYAVGSYVTQANIFQGGWRSTFAICGLPGFLLASALLFFVKEPAVVKQKQRPMHQNIGNNNFHEDMESRSPSPTNDEEDTFSEEDLFPTDETQVLIVQTSQGASCDDISTSYSSDSNSRPAWKTALTPPMIVLSVAACIRHTSGFSWGYNSALYFQTYYPTYDAGWWLTWISILGGSFGVALGGFASDKLIRAFGSATASRAFVLATSSLLGSPFVFVLFYMDPPRSFYYFFIGFIFGAMWYGVVFATFLELLPAAIRSTGLAVALFIMNNVGGNLPLIVHPLTQIWNYKTAIVVVYPGFQTISAVLFFVLYFMLKKGTLKT